MCLFALFFRAVDDAPLVVAANREEFYRRQGTPPQILPGPPRAVAGLDPQAGGTWLGVNEYGVVAAVTNRDKAQVPAQPRSRGLLVRDLLACRTAKEAVALATRALDGSLYAGCNLVCADPERVVVVHGADWLRVVPLPPGLHVLTNRDVNSLSDPRVAYASWWLAQQPYARASDCLDAFRKLCGQAGDGAPPMCLHGPERGTVSSSLIALRSSLADSTYLHAQGPPDRTPYLDCSHLLRQIAPGGNGA
jgi:uncharacterized protein with NRDE domain